MKVKELKEQLEKYYDDDVVCQIEYEGDDYSWLEIDYIQRYDNIDYTDKDLNEVKGNVIGIIE